MTLGQCGNLYTNKMAQTTKAQLILFPEATTALSSPHHCAAEEHCAITCYPKGAKHKAQWLPRTYHRGDSKILLTHPLLQPINFPSRVEENHSLSDCQCLIQVTKCFKLPILIRNSKERNN